MPFHRFYRVAWFTPMLVSGVIVGIVFRWIFDYDWGLLNQALRAMGLDALGAQLAGAARHAHLGRDRRPLLGDRRLLVRPPAGGADARSRSTCWKRPISTARRACGAVWHVLLPLLRPTWVTVLILSFMGKMNAFNVVWVLTNGGPMHASETVATYIQKRAFGWNTLDLGYPAALSVVWFGAVLIGVFALRRWLQRKAEL